MMEIQHRQELPEVESQSMQRSHGSSQLSSTMMHTSRTPLSPPASTQSSHSPDIPGHVFIPNSESRTSQFDSLGSRVTMLTTSPTDDSATPSSPQVSQSVTSGRSAIQPPTASYKLDCRSQSSNLVFNFAPSQANHDDARARPGNLSAVEHNCHCLSTADYTCHCVGRQPR